MKSEELLLKEAKNIIKSLIKVIPLVGCENLHHNKNDFHSELEECPCEKRILEEKQRAISFLNR
jgi:hypothetical protein